MAETRIVNELACSEAVFWEKCFLDAEFNRQFYLEELGFVEWKILNETSTNELILREIEVVPQASELPGPLKAVLGDALGYREVGRFDRTRRRYTVKATSPKLGDRFSFDGEMYTEPLGEGRCRRIFKVSVTAKIFGVGGLLEKRVIADLEKSYVQSAAYINRRASSL
jgi:hypothetical protein